MDASGEILHNDIDCVMACDGLKILHCFERGMPVFCYHFCLAVNSLLIVPLISSESDPNAIASSFCLLPQLTESMPNNSHRNVA